MADRSSCKAKTHCRVRDIGRKHLLTGNHCHSRPLRVEVLERRDLLAVTVSGTITYGAFSTPNDLQFPARGLSVKAYGVDTATNEFWDTSVGFTDDNGEFSLTIDDPTGAGPFRVYVVARTYAAPDGDETRPAYGIYPESSVGTAFLYPHTFQVFGNLPLESGETSLGPFNHHFERNTWEGDLLQIFDALTTGYKAYAELPNREPSGVDLVYPDFGSETAYYSWKTNNIYLPYELIDWDIILEEFGHHIEDINGFDDFVTSLLPGASDHDPTWNARFQGSFLPFQPNNGQLLEKHSNLAFLEGWGQYFSVWAQQQYAPDAIDDVKDLSVEDFDIERSGIGFESLGEDNEVSVARILWDMADGSTEVQDDDELSHGHEWLWNVVSENEITWLNQLWDVYQDHPDPTDQNKIDLGGIYESHNAAAQPISATPDLDAGTISFEFRISSGRDDDEGRPFLGPVFNRFRIQVYDENGDPLVEDPDELKLRVYGVQAISSTFGFTVRLAA